MSEKIRFTLDGREVVAPPGATLWQVAQDHGTAIPHLCYADEPGYRPDGNCRACMVEIKGERVLAASCLRTPTPGMVVSTGGERARKARMLVMEMLAADQPPREAAHDRSSHFWRTAEGLSIRDSRFPPREVPRPDKSHPAMAVNLDACIHCTLCVRACREVQVNDVIGMAGRGAHTRVVFDFDDPMGESTCVACGECVQACPTGALMPSSLVDETGRGDSTADSTVASVCPWCGVGCQIDYHVSDGKISYVSGHNGPANEKRLCVKGRFGLGYVTHPHRLTVPLIRRDGVKKGPEPTIDPASPQTHFREATWEEALDRAARGLVRIRDRYGPEALAGFGSAKCTNEEAYLFQKLVRTGFGSNNVDHCTRLCHASSVAALLETIGTGAVTATFNEVDNADVIFVIGANPAENHPVAATYFKQATKRGATLIIADPRGNELKRHATYMLQHKPGSDVALLNAMMNVIVSENLFDTTFIMKRTEGFEAMRRHLEAFTPEEMAKVCGIDAHMIRNVARVYAKAEAAIIFWGMGMSQYVHGTDNCRALIALALMCGHVGRPGTGLHPLRGQNNVQGASDAGLIPMMLPDYHRTDDDAARAVFETLWQQNISSQPGLTVVEIMDRVADEQIRGMYILGENPAMSDPDIGHVRAALAKMNHLVVQDIFLTETAQYADVVLPATAWPEKEGTVTNTNRQVQMGRKAINSPGDARPDWWIIQEMANRIGLDWHYGGPADVFEEMKAGMPSLDNISWERLTREGGVTYPCSAPDEPGQAVILTDSFPTDSGRGKLVPVAIIPPNERPDQEYPMVLTTGRQLEHWHTGAMSRRSETLDAIEPDAVACLSSADLRRIGAKPGETIKIVTRRGEIALKARLDGAVPEGAVFVPFCYAEAAANFLTNPALDPYGKIPEFKYCAARVERVEDSAMDVAD